MVYVSRELMVCRDCLFFIANGDLPEDKGVADMVVAGVKSFAPGHVVAGDYWNDSEFSWRPCECCGTTLGGSRYDAAVLMDEGSK